MGRERTFQREEMLKREGQRAAVIMASVGHDITSLAPVNVLKDTQAVTVVRVCVCGGGDQYSRRQCPAQYNHLIRSCITN